MDFPVNLVIEIKDQEEYDQVQNALDLLRNHSLPTVSTKFEWIDRATFRKVSSAEESRVLINGHPIATGTKEDMEKRYQTECAMHEKSNIVHEEWADGSFKTVSVRRLQKFARPLL